jgi:dUTP pyrophosphatase
MIKIIISKEESDIFSLVAVDSSPIEFELVDNLSESSRGEGGFGSTGR